MLRKLRVALLCAAMIFVPAVGHAAYIDFAVSVTQLVAGPTTYSFLFGSPVLPGFYDSASSIGELTVTPGPGGEASVAVSAIYPAFISGYGMVGAASTNLGVDQGTVTCTAVGGLPTTCQFPLLTASFAPTFYDGMEALLTFEVTGLGTLAAFTGRVTLEQSQAPEPATVLLFGTAVLAAARARRRFELSWG